jgi:hypothetical protein
MSADSPTLPESNQEGDQKERKARKPYHKPQLQKLGDIRTSTLGPTFGMQDSGGMTGFH